MDANNFSFFCKGFVGKVWRGQACAECNLTKAWSTRCYEENIIDLQIRRRKKSGGARAE